jgi:hypothetical protein
MHFRACISHACIQSHFLGFQVAGYTVQFPGMRLSTVHGVTDCALGARRARGQHLSRRRDSRRCAEQTEMSNKKLRRDASLRREK